MKLWQIVGKKLGLWKPPVEVFQENKIFNPLRAKVGGGARIDTLDYRKNNYKITEVREYTVGGNRWADYVLCSPEDDGWLRLRVVPGSEGNTVLALDLYDDLAYNEGLHVVLKDDTGKFVVDDDKGDDNPDNDVHEEYFRVGGVKTPYDVVVKSLADDDHSGKVDESEVKNLGIQFWDYSRTAQVDGVERTETLFVEMDKESGWMQIWRGAEINPERVSVW